MLQEEHEVYKAEVLRHSENVALRLTEYLTRCHVQRQAMAEHRESIMRVAEQVANEPAVLELPEREEDVRFRE